MCKKAKLGVTSARRGRSRSSEKPERVQAVQLSISAGVSARVSARVSACVSTCVSGYLRLCLYPCIGAQEGAETGAKVEVVGLYLTTLGKR